MPLLGFNPADYFASLKDTVDISSSPEYTLADAPYSATNAATIPTVSVASPFSNLKQWSLDSTGEYAKVQSAKAPPTSQYLIYAAAAVLLLMVLKQR